MGRTAFIRTTPIEWRGGAGIPTLREGQARQRWRSASTAGMGRRSIRRSDPQPVMPGSSRPSSRRQRPRRSPGCRRHSELDDAVRPPVAANALTADPSTVPPRIIGTPRSANREPTAFAELVRRRPTSAIELSCENSHTPVRTSSSTRFSEHVADGVQQATTFEGDLDDGLLLGLRSAFRPMARSCQSKATVVVEQPGVRWAVRDTGWRFHLLEAAISFMYPHSRRQ